jgi:hypothetical protein
VNAAAIDTRNAIALVIQVRARRPRQAAMKNFPHRCTTMKKKNSSVLQRCVLLTKWPTDEVCHQVGPARAITAPEMTMTTNADRDRTPKTYTHEAT